MTLITKRDLMLLALLLSGITTSALGAGYAATFDDPWLRLPFGGVMILAMAGQMIAFHRIIARLEREIDDDKLGLSKLRNPGPALTRSAAK